MAWRALAGPRASAAMAALPWYLVLLLHQQPWATVETGPVDHGHPAVAGAPRESSGEGGTAAALARLMPAPPPTTLHHHSHYHNTTMDTNNTLSQSLDSVNTISVVGEEEVSTSVTGNSYFGGATYILDRPNLNWVAKIC